MSRNGNRTVQISKAKLIKQITQNKDKHVELYGKAVEAYKINALKQLADLKSEAEKGNIKLSLNLVTPIDNSKHYDEILSMFEWEERESVELSQQEFNEYVLDKTESSRHAAFSNMTYLAG